MPQLTGLGDTDARRASRRVPCRILEPVETVGNTKAENLLSPTGESACPLAIEGRVTDSHGKMMLAGFAA
jgi:hypothetical protein